LIRPSVRFLTIAAVAVLALSAACGSAQTQVPAAPSAQTQVPAAPSEQPSAPTPAQAPKFPTPDPANFTAASPTKDQVNAFLHASWGYDENRAWQIEAIQKTKVDGVSKVVVDVADKTNSAQSGQITFFTMPDGKHLISSDQVIAFGDNPYADLRAIMQQRADGPYRGAAAKDLEIVEFADFQCPHCKDAQANMDKLLADFPKARIVFENYPLESIHPQAAEAAAYGECVAKMGGSTAFFQFTASVFDGQDGLATADGAALTLNSSATKVGLDPAKVAACATTPEIKAQVEASVKLAQDIELYSTPTLYVNGRQVPANIEYATLKKIVAYQAKIDGVAGQ
jgi:protein-disulfide isomerase